ncbi:MAG TPA: hypothetical protein ENJ87_09620 [Gammaproteobacteria bacterium]|nr:hypothetical protein [Gammaproteobacteria bacterium]
MNKSKYDDPLDALGDAYEKLYEHTATDIHKLKDEGGPKLHQIIEEAKDKAVELDELAADDAVKLVAWLKRDLQDAVNYLSEAGHEIKDWLGFETDLLENELFYMFLDVADKTTVELQQFKENAEHPEYHTGEISGPGTLTCDECGEKLHFYKAGRIPPCPKCHTTVFHRSTSEL